MESNGVCLYAVTVPVVFTGDLFFFHCANIGWPCGPPKITQMPSSKETNFHATVISLLDKL